MKHTLFDRSRAYDKNNIARQIAVANADNAPILTDGFGRNFPYLRLSITDICNFSCDYCLPDGYKCSGKPNFLSLSEIGNLVAGFAALGTRKIRLTGGEPTLRRDFSDIVRLIAENDKIDKLAFTTNGYKLAENIEQWREAGINAINVSIDTLDRDGFYKLTGHDRLPQILQGIDAALELGFSQVKVNAVLLKGVNDQQFDNFLDWVKHKPIGMRFIELMQTGDNLDYFNKYHLSANILSEKLLNQGWVMKQRAFDAGPAQEFVHADYVGSIGIIAPYSKDFCTDCNRLRITSTGDLRLCLFGNQGTSIRHLLQDESQLEDLKQLILTQLSFKKSTHFLAMGDTGATANLSTIGG